MVTDGQIPDRIKNQACQIKLHVGSVTIWQNQVHDHIVVEECSQYGDDAAW